jgi:hypothetical protein
LAINQRALSVTHHQLATALMSAKAGSTLPPTLLTAGTVVHGHKKPVFSQ